MAWRFNPFTRKLEYPQQDVEPQDSPTFATAKLTSLTDGKMPYHVDDATGFADGPVKTDVDDAVTKKHVAVTVSAPIALSGQALSLINNAVSPGTITTVDIDGTLAGNSDVYIPTQKAVKTYADLKLAKASNLSDVANAATAFTNIKQSATESATGVAELATVTEAITGTDTSRITTPAGVAAAAAVLKNPLAFAQGIHMVAATTGEGMSVADNNNIDNPTNNFAVFYKVRLADWTPSIITYFVDKYGADSKGIRFIVLTDGKLFLRITSTMSFTSTVATGLPDGAEAQVGAIVTRETALAAGSVIFLVNGVQLGDAVAITAGATATISNAQPLYLASQPGSYRYAEAIGSCIMYNRAPSVAEALSLYQTGIAAADQYGSQTNRITSTENQSFTGGTIGNWVFEGGGGGNGTCTYDAGPAAEKTGMLTVGATAGTGRYARLKGYDYATRLTNYTKIRYEADVYIPAASTVTIVRMAASFVGMTETTYKYADLTLRDQWQRIWTEFSCTTGGGDTNQWIYIYWSGGVTGDAIYYDNVNVVQIGATLALENEGIQRDAWKDSSTNGLNASYPASGYSFLRPIITDSAEGLLSVTTVSLAADADTTIYTVPTGKRLVLTKAILVVGADAGTSVISIGADGAETDWLPNNTLSAIDAANDAAILQPVPNTTPVLVKSYAGGTVIQAKVSSHAGGATNSLSLFGYLY